MTATRMHPPTLAGYTYIDYLGGGGYADVFLYEQHRPRRKVAVKVLRRPVTDTNAQAQFDAEADLMATVSSHQFIVSIFAADVADDQRPYIVMEYYPRAHFGKQAKERPLPIADALRIGVWVSSAIETAHRTGIIHRDIKPANILASDFGNEYGRPGLTDFGISGTRVDGALEHASGVSIGFTAPEIITEESAGDERSDVYSLGATVYALLTGHSPFERSGANKFEEVMQRVLSDAPPPLGRRDAPASLDFLLRQTLAKNPKDRPQSALAFARSLRDIERELQLNQTAIELPDSGSQSHQVQPAGDDDATRHVAIQVIQHAPNSQATSSPRQPAASAEIDGIPTGLTPEMGGAKARPKRTTASPEALGETVLRKDLAADTSLSRTTQRDDKTRPPTRRMIWVAAVSGVVVASLLVAGLSGSSPKKSTTTTLPDEPPETVEAILEFAGPPKVVRSGDKAVVTWQPPLNAKPGQKYTYQVRDQSGQHSLLGSTWQQELTATVKLPETARACFTVALGESGSEGGRIISPPGCIP